MIHDQSIYPCVVACLPCKNCALNRESEMWLDNLVNASRSLLVQASRALSLMRRADAWIPRPSDERDQASMVHLLGGSLTGHSDGE